MTHETPEIKGSEIKDRLVDIKASTSIKEPALQGGSAVVTDLSPSMDSVDELSNLKSERLDHRPQPQEQWQSFDQIPLSPVEPRHYTQVLIETATISIIFITILSVFLIFVATIPLPIAAIVIPALLMIGSGITWVRYLNAKAIGYAVCSHELVMQTGIFWVKRISLPYTRLQHISLSQGPLERKFYLRTLKCFSAGSGSAEIELPGLESKTAEKLRQHLLSMAAIAIKTTAIINVNEEVNQKKINEEEPAADRAEQ
ncbi:PH domain-containing protein [Shewanella atlantica]|nr:PH domain-containing protein [Shewanella atlantica]